MNDYDHDRLDRDRAADAWDDLKAQRDELLAALSEYKGVLDDRYSEKGVGGFARAMLAARFAIDRARGGE